MPELITAKNYKTCSDCGSSYTDYGNPLPFCQTCHTVMQCLILHRVQQYQRWKVLPYDDGVVTNEARGALNVQ